MRDAFGGVFMIRLFLVFIVIYVAFTAVSLNYAKAFRIKNSVISFIEENEIISLDNTYLTNKLDKLDVILTAANYNKTCRNGNGSIISVEGINTGYCYNGVVILKNGEESVTGTNSKIIKYQVITYADWNIGMLNKLLALSGRSENSEEYVTGTWEIRGEAKVVSRG